MASNPVYRLFNPMTTYYPGTDPQQDDEMFGEDLELGEIQAQPQTRNNRQISKVYEAFYQFLQTGEVEDFYKVADKYRESLKFRVTFLPDLKRILSSAKNPDDFSLCRKIAFFEGLFNPTSLFARMIQALDYLRMGNSASASSLLKRNNRNLNLEMGYAIAGQALRYERKNPMVSYYLTNLLGFLSRETSSRKRKREDDDIGLRV